MRTIYVMNATAIADLKYIIKSSFYPNIKPIYLFDGQPSIRLVPYTPPNN